MRGFVALTALGAVACFALAIPHPSFSGMNEFLCYLAITLLASSLKVTLPGIDGTLSVSYVFLLVGILEMTYAETLILAVASVVVQSYWRKSKRLRPIQTVFNLSQLIVATSAAYATFHLVRAHMPRGETLFGLSWAAIVYFACNTSAMSGIIALSEGRSFRSVWTKGYLWSFPHYVIGAAIAFVVGYLNNSSGWQVSLLILPIIYVIYRSYTMYVGRLQDEKVHAEQVTHLHLRTIETLALAIEAKDQATGEHLQRVRIYAMRLAQELGLSQPETEALRAASVLHDIGKLAVPEHIITKPGKLTPEEFEKMKIHPTVGAEILEQIDFPYPVAPIVRAHHEKWNGSGYPSGLIGEAIPIGARILSAVDCLDALASDRQYRKALPLDQAMAKVASDSGIAFDPKVVDILQANYVAWEELARQQGQQALPKLSTDVKVKPGLAPDAGFAESATVVSAEFPPEDFAHTLVCARKESQTLAALSTRFGNDATVDDILSLLAVRLKRLLRQDALVIYLRRNDTLQAALSSGENSRAFSSLQIAVGEGLCGWVAQNHRPIVNGSPSVEPGYLEHAAQLSPLRSALAAPLEASAGVAAVVALYRTEADAFTKADLEIVEALTLRMGFVIEQSMGMKALGASASSS